MYLKYNNATVLLMTPNLSMITINTNTNQLMITQLCQLKTEIVKYLGNRGVVILLIPRTQVCP